MTYCAEYCIEMPDDFPVEELTLFMATARRVLLATDKSLGWQEFSGASNLIGWRFRASSEDWQTYKTSLASFGNNANHEELYRRERALFGMFSSGVSSIESTIYALAALFSHPAVLSFSFGPDQQRACNPKKLLDWLRPYPVASTITSILNERFFSREWNLWVDLRNRMTHRSNLPRRIFAALGGPLPVSRDFNFAATTSTPEVEADLVDFENLRSWLANTLRTLLVTGRQLVDGE